MRSLFLFSLFIFYTAATFAQDKTSTRPGETYAVIIGISDYGAGGIPHLKYADRDAMAFASYLKSTAGGSLPEEHIKLLVNDQATLLNIDIALRWLLQTCHEGDIAYFYFSGHGDVENSTINPAGFLLCYNAPVNNYNINSLEVRRVNDVANTISRATNGNIIMITDACHSGKLAGSENAGSLLVGTELAKVKNREVRITSCAANEKSLEIDDLAGGRGLFSYHLLNGFYGAADSVSDGVVTLAEIRKFLNQALSNDPSLKYNNMKQSPVVEGRDDFKLAKIDPAAKAALINQLSVTLPARTVPETEELTEPLPLANYFFDQLKKYNIDDLVRDAPASLQTAANILQYFVTGLKKMDTTAVSHRNLDRFTSILADPEFESQKTDFANRLASVMDDRGQAVINLYLNGDESELQKRMYTNSSQFTYDVYPKMFALARILIGNENIFMNRILEVKQYYFAGVATRLKMFTSKNPASVLKEALVWEQKALALEKNGSFIYNEIGVIYKFQGNNILAEKNFLQAIKLLPKWGIPKLNLAAVYVSRKETAKALQAIQEAEQTQPALYNIRTAKGYLMELKKDMLQAEELYRNAISINNRYYFPYERLGYVYMNTSRYAMADSFFHEAAIRKTGIHFNWINNPEDPSFAWVLPPRPPRHVSCPDARRDTLNIYYLFYLADSAYKTLKYPYDSTLNDNTYAFAEKYFRKIIQLQPDNYLSFHYMSEMMYRRQNWQAAEQYLNWAIVHYTDEEKFVINCDYEYQQYLTSNPGNACWVNYYKSAYPWNLRNGEYNLQLALLHETWEHTNEAADNYRKFIYKDPSSRIYELSHLAVLYEKAGLYRETEATLKDGLLFTNNNFQNKSFLSLELDRFYKRTMNRFPEDPEWKYKSGNFLYAAVRETPEGYPMHGYHVDSFSYRLKYQELPFDFHTRQKILVLSEPRRRAIEYLLQAAASPHSDSNTFADIYYKTGDIYAMLHEPDSAAGYFKSSLQLRPDNANTRMNLATADSASGQLVDAMNQLDTLHMLKALNAEQQTTLAEFKIYSNNRTGADSLLSKSAYAIPYANRRIVDLQGLFYTQSGNHAMALNYYKELLKLNPNDSDALYNIARTMELSGKPIESLKWLEKSLDSGFRYYAVLNTDPAWTKARSTGKFQSLLKKYEPKVYIEPKELIPPKNIEELESQKD